MKRLRCILFFVIFVFIFSTTPLRAAEIKPRPVVWSYRLANPAPAPGETVELIISAELPPHWIVYSSDFKADIGPQPTAFVFEKSDRVEAVGEIRAVNPKQKKDPTWDTDLRYFTDRAEFRQQIRVTKKEFILRGTIKGQLCNEQDGTCTLFEESILLSSPPAP